MADARSLFAPLPARYDRLAEVLSFYQNSRWRSLMVSRVPTGAGLIADIAAGTAGVSLALAARCPDARVLGVDLSLPMLREGQRRVSDAGVSGRVGLVNGRGEHLPLASASVDALTFTYLLRYVADPEAVLHELARVLKPGAVMANLEFGVPSGPAWWPSWYLYTRFVLPTAGLVTGGMPWWRVGRFLGPSISSHYQRYPVDWTVSAWRSAGFTDVGYRRMSLGGGLVMWGTRV
jgi:demethylmenaquinone methyltransferase/2-methoxy-6-polyprenyl-1,4-benzoquinol methylase